MHRAIGAARAAFDVTDWSTNRALRKRCLGQLQAALEAEKDELREELVAEVGCPVMTTQSAQLDWPLAESLRYPARLIDAFEWERVLEGGGLFGDRNVRTVVKEAVGVVAADHAVELPDRGHPQQARPSPGCGQHRRPQAGPTHTVERHPAGPADRREDRRARRCGQRRHDDVQRRGRDAGYRSARGSGLVHRLHGGRQAPDAAGCRHHEADVPRARRQVRGDRPRRRQPRGDRAGRGGRLRARRTGLCSDQPDADPSFALRPGGCRHHRGVSACAGGGSG